MTEASGNSPCTNWDYISQKVHITTIISWKKELFGLFLYKTLLQKSPKNGPQRFSPLKETMTSAMARLTKCLNNTYVSKQCRIWIKTPWGYIENNTEPKKKSEREREGEKRRAGMQRKRAEMKKSRSSQLFRTSARVSTDVQSSYLWAIPLF